MARSQESSSLAWLPLGVLTIVLGATPLGYLPVPGTAQFLTIAHIPVVLGGVLCGPFIGLVLGLLFGLGNCWLVPPHDPSVQILPRALSGLVAGVVFWAARRYGNPHSQITVGSLCAALAGSFTNTLGIVIGAVLKGLMPTPEIFPVILFHGCPEALLAVIVTLPFAVLRGSSGR
ncbi:MAG: ECF transporter S component [Vulcanimicrobiota bacterium]